MEIRRYWVHGDRRYWVNGDKKILIFYFLNLTNYCSPIYLLISYPAALIFYFSLPRSIPNEKGFKMNWPCTQNRTSCSTKISTRVSLKPGNICQKSINLNLASLKWIEGATHYLMNWADLKTARKLNRLKTKIDLRCCKLKMMNCILRSRYLQCIYLLRVAIVSKKE